MAMRLSGLGGSGLDTDTIVKELVKANRAKVDDLKKEQTMLGWQQDAWKSINSKLFTFYRSLTTLQSSSAYQKKTTSSSDESILKVAGAGAANGVQTATVEALAKSGSLTGGELSLNDGTKVKGDSKVADIDGLSGIPGSFYIKSGSGTAYTEVRIDENTTVDGLVEQMNNAGVSASFDAANGRFFVMSASTGVKNDFELFTKDTSGAMVGATAANSPLLSGLKMVGAEAHKMAAGDARLKLNGATFTSDTNSFKINGMTLMAQKVSSTEVTVNTADDYEGFYNTVKKLVKDYNSIINEIDSLTNADAAKGYEPLSDEEKESMSDKQVEEWEKKIKDSMFRGDSTLSGISSMLYTTMTGGYEVNGEKMFLSDFGIGGLGYFVSGENEKHAVHIDGNAEDEDTAAKPDKLKKMIAADPQTAVDFFTKLGEGMYKSLNEKMMQRSDFKSIYKVYNDKQMKTEYDSYKKKISDAETKLKAYEDKWYEKFSAMETAMSKMNSKQSALSGLLGM